MGNVKTSWKLGSGELRWIHTDLLCDRDNRGTKRAEKQCKKQKIKNIIRYPRKKRASRNYVPIIQHWDLKGRMGFYFNMPKFILLAAKRLATQKINVRLSLDFWNSLHTFLLSYFSIPLEITGIKGHYKVGPS